MSKCFWLGLHAIWRVGKYKIKEGNFRVLDYGPNSQHGHRGCGVGILLSRAETIAWKAVGPDNLHNDIEFRVIDFRLRVVDPT